ncbi:hypothetical protein, partial [Enterobacter hormaechei]
FFVFFFFVYMLLGLKFSGYGFFLTSCIKDICLKLLWGRLWVLMRGFLRGCFGGVLDALPNAAGINKK